MNGRAVLMIGAALAVIAGGGFTVYSKIAGLRNNNPGNLRASTRYTWRGQVGIDAPGFCIFDTWQHGMRALMIDLRNQQNIHGLDSVAAIITKYAPPSENKTEAYIKAVAAAMGVARDQRLNLRDPAQLASMARAITRHENGIQPYKVAEVEQIARAA